MGLEAECWVRQGGRRARGKAKLETSDLSFRGDLRVTIPFPAITAAREEGGDLCVEHGGVTTIFELGAAAPKWLEKIRAPKGRLDKLGVKQDLRACVIGPIEDAFRAELRERLGGFAEEAGEGHDLVFFGAEARGDLARLGALVAALAPAGALWVVRPKGKAEITEAEVMAAGKRAGLVDVKVVSFSATHTAEKFVIPVAKRPAAKLPLAKKTAVKKAASKKASRAGSR